MFSICPGTNVNCVQEKLYSAHVQIKVTVGWLFWAFISVYTGPSPRERGRKKEK